MPDRSSKRPRDLNQLATRLVDEATGDSGPKPIESAKARAGREGGRKGGSARAAKLTAEQRSAAARKAAAARWSQSRPA